MSDTNLNVTSHISLKEMEARYDAQEAALAGLKPASSLPMSEKSAATPPPGWNGASTLAQASGEESAAALAASFPQLRPKLDPPTKNFQLMLVDMYRDVESSVTAGSRLAHDQLKLDGQRQEELMKKKFDALLKEIELAKTQKNWNAFTGAVQYVGYFLLLVTTSPAGLTGGAYYAAKALQIAAGFGLAQKISEDTGLTRALLDFATNSKETQATIETSMSYLAAAASLTTFIVAWQTRVLGAGASTSDAADLIEKLAGFGSVPVSLAQLGGSWTARRRVNLKADIKELDVAKTFATKEMEQRMQDTQQYTKTLSTVGNSIKAALANAEIHSIEA